MNEAKARELLQELVDLFAPHSPGCDCDYCAPFVPARAYLAAVPAPPAGPPREPTENMIHAGRAEQVRHQTDKSFRPGHSNVTQIWRAMCDAAPAAEPAWPKLPTADDYGIAAEPVAQQPPPHVATKSQGATSAPQPEAPTLADDEPWPHAWWVSDAKLVAMRALDRYGEVMDTVIAQAQQTWGMLARIESDAERIRGLEAAGDALAERGRELRDERDASRERERAAYERAAEVCEDQGTVYAADFSNKHFGPMSDACIACAKRIRTLATPDSAAEPTTGQE